MMIQSLASWDWRGWIVVAVSAVVSLILIALSSRIPRISGEAHHLRAVQATHVHPTPRVGGLAIMSAIMASLLLLPDPSARAYAGFLMAAGVLFFAGLAEDMGFGVSPRGRLLAALISSLLVIVIFQVWLTRADVPGLDALMPMWVIGVPVTLLVTAGISNGFNLIDGIHGLAAVTAIVASLALAAIAVRAGDPAMPQVAVLFAAAVLGFLLVNYPFGLIFLGDAGAYVIGFALSWFGIAIVQRSAEVTPWALLLTVFWPVADTMLAIYRRARRRGPAMMPDRLHVHQMVMRGLEIMGLGRHRRRITNPLTTLVLIPFIVAPPATGVLLWNRPMAALLAFMVFVGLFFAAYLAALTFISNRRP